MATTQRLLILVISMSPTFSAYAVSGNEFMNPASTADSPSVARPRARPFSLSGRSTISATANMSAVDSV